MKKFKTLLEMKYLVIAGAALAGGACGAILCLLVIYPPACAGYSYINRGFACHNDQVISKAGYAQLKDSIVQYIQQQYASGNASDTAVYFRDLVGGPTFGINEDETFIPASLLKLPVIMSIFSQEEQQPGFIQASLAYSTSSLQVSVPQGIETPDVPGMRFGQSYTIEQLMASTIINSDNLAYYLVVGYMDAAVPSGSGDIDSALQQLGIVDPQNVDQQSVSVNQYASLFRLLYNVSYLDPAHSEELLSWLVQSTFRDGLKAGVPQSVAVADKWGLRTLPDGSQELHDCGIVYYPQNPYIICVMTEGSDQTALADVIATISRMVYQEVDSRRLQ